MSTLSFSSLLLGTLCLVSSCQSPPASTDQTPQAATAAIAGAPTTAALKAIISAYLQQQPEAALYQIDSMRVLDVGTYWQVMVPRTDWAERMPNAAAFDVDKQSGRITTRPVK